MYALNVQDIVRFLRQFAPRSHFEGVNDAALNAQPANGTTQGASEAELPEALQPLYVEVRLETGEREGKVYTRWHLFPDGAPIYTMEIDPEHERQLLAFRCRNLPLVETGTPLARPELLDAINSVNLLMEPAHFFLDDGHGEPTLNFIYTVPADNNHFSYEQLKRMAIETMLWVSCLVPELQRVAQGAMSPEAFLHWLQERSEQLFKGSADERMRWWLERCLEASGEGKPMS
ncbi:MAG: hypothetical protein ABDI19_01550 [Armatimonadota bacterium]